MPNVTIVNRRALRSMSVSNVYSSMYIVRETQLVSPWHKRGKWKVFSIPVPKCFFVRNLMHVDGSKPLLNQELFERLVSSALAKARSKLLPRSAIVVRVHCECLCVAGGGRPRRILRQNYFFAYCF